MFHLFIITYILNNYNKQTFYMNSRLYFLLAPPHWLSLLKECADALSCI